MKILSLVLILLLSYSAAADVYRWVDKDGKVHFGDNPPKGVDYEKVELKEMIEYQQQFSPPVRKSSKAEKAPKYKKCQLTSPSEPIIRTRSRNVTLGFQCKVALAPGHQYRIKRNGDTVGKTRSSSWSFTDLALGEHNITVQVINEKGRLVKTVLTSKFTLLLPLRAN